MTGPYSLTLPNVDTSVTRTSPGAYLLGRSNSGWSYVGRSDTDLNVRLKSWVGKGYAYFWFEYASSPKAAFERECGIWHQNGGPQGKLDNKNHPQRPAGTDWRCPICRIFG